LNARVLEGRAPRAFSARRQPRPRKILGAAPEFRKKAGDGGPVVKCPVFLIGKRLEGLIFPRNWRRWSKRGRFCTAPRAAPIAHGIDATVLPQVCDVLDQRRHGRSASAQSVPLRAERARIVIRGPRPCWGLSALLTKGDGLPERSALGRPPARYFQTPSLRKELAAWVKRFPDEFYREIFPPKRLELDGK